MRPPYEFEIQGQKYQARRMSGMTQMQVSRRVAPLLVGAIPPFLEMWRSRQAPSPAPEGEAPSPEVGEDQKTSSLLDMDVTKIIPALQSSTSLLASMPDADFDFITASCLSLVSIQRQGGTGWMPIWNPAARALQFEDIDGSTMLLIVVEILKMELAPFMQGLVSSL